MILIALMCTRISQSPDVKFQRVITYLTFQTPFYSGFESVTNIVFSFEPNYSRPATVEVSIRCGFMSGYEIFLLFD